MGLLLQGGCGVPDGRNGGHGQGRSNGGHVPAYTNLSAKKERGGLDKAALPEFLGDGEAAIKGGGDVGAR
jgi:hypothetical protein